MSLWYQWFIAAPMITIDLPCVLSAFSANWRATVITCVARRAGDALLPGRRVGRVVVETLRREFAGQAARHAVVARPAGRTPWPPAPRASRLLAERDALHRHRAHQHIGSARCSGNARWRCRRSTGKPTLRVSPLGCVAFEQRQLELHVVAVARFLGFEVPLALRRRGRPAPAKADRAVAAARPCRSRRRRPSSTPGCWPGRACR